MQLFLSYYLAAGEYPEGLDEGMGPEGTGSGPLELGRF